MTDQQILITGANGFVGRNLAVRMGELANMSVLRFTRDDAVAKLEDLITKADVVVHLAGENRPADPADFDRVNVGLTETICNFIRASGRSIPLIVTSSTQAVLDNPYGRSKRAGELVVEALASDTGNPCTIFQLPNIFGKWCRPNYNSAVATFAHNIARNLPIQINDPSAKLRLVYIDDVVTALIAAATTTRTGLTRSDVTPEYQSTVGAVAGQLRAFADSRSNLVSERVGTGLTRALYSTYVSYLPTASFQYDIPTHGDARGVFVEMLKTPDCGQFSFFTAHPGITRGGHYHHSKTEKFLVIKGNARFGFRHILTDEYHELTTTGTKPQIVETVPGWTHDITNIGEEEMIVMLWANEIFDRERPDTIARKV